MARRRAHAPLSVFVNARRVGTLEREPTGAIAFTYARDWLDWAPAFPVSLSLPLREDRFVGAPVINVFDNLLPDSALIRRQLAERVGAGGTDAFSLLSAVGHDCVGALQFLPDGADPGTAGGTEGQPVDDVEIADILAHLGSAPLGVGADEAFRISIAGAQEKTALLRKDGRWLKPSGTAATTHILKPQIGRLPNGVDLSESVENEYFCLKLMAGFGLPVAAAEIVDFEDRRTLVVERFDRLWARDGRLLRLPQEDMCQAMSVPSTRKYEAEGGPGMRDIIALLKGSDTPEADIAAFLKATMIFWLIGATDGHAKNFSLFLSQGGQFRMTPLYDVLTAQPSCDARQIERKAFRLSLAVGRSRHYRIDEIVPRHFLETADLAGAAKSAARGIVADLAESAARVVEDVAALLPGGFPEPIVASVATAVARRAKLCAEAAL